MYRRLRYIFFVFIKEAGRIEDERGDYLLWKWRRIFGRAILRFEKNNNFVLYMLEQNCYS